MSLINDALRRARQEAAEREAREKGLPPPVFSPRRRRMRSLPPAGVLMAVGLGALVLGVLVAVLAVRPGSRSGTGDAMRTAASTSSMRGSREPAPSADAGSVPRSTPRERGGRRVAASRPTATPPPHAATSRPPVTSASPRAAATSPPTRTPPTPTPSVSTPATREFRGEAVLGGTTLRLDYLVYRPSDPFAEINGVEVHEGWEIEGYTVVRIQTDRVVLEGPDGRVVLRAR